MLTRKAYAYSIRLINLAEITAASTICLIPHLFGRSPGPNQVFSRRQGEGGAQHGSRFIATSTSLNMTKSKQDASTATN
jgi:hypothetical protein